MITCQFTLVLAGVAEIAPELADRLYESTGGDIELSMYGGVATIEFRREAESFSEAVGAAIYQVEQAATGARIVRVESEAAEAVAQINAELFSSAVDAK